MVNALLFLGGSGGGGGGYSSSDTTDITVIVDWALKINYICSSSSSSSSFFATKYCRIRRIRGSRRCLIMR